MGDMADWDIDQGIASEIEEPWLADEQEAEKRRLAKRCRHREHHLVTLRPTRVLWCPECGAIKNGSRRWVRPTMHKG